MSAEEPPGGRVSEHAQPSLGHLVGITGRQGQPFWGLMGLWAVLCGAMASGHLRWRGEDLLTLSMVVLLAELAWGSLWDLVTRSDWPALLRRCGGVPVPTRPAALPYTRAGSPVGRLTTWLVRRAGWWRGIFWPAAGPVFLGTAAGAALMGVLGILLPERLYPLHGAFCALVAIGVVSGRRDWLAGGSLVLVGLGWMAGYLAFSPFAVTDLESIYPSLVLALGFSLAVWGALRLARGRCGALWLLNGGLAIAAALLAWRKQPLAAGAVGLLLLGAVALQPWLRLGKGPAQVARHAWLWLMAAMLVSAVALV